MNGKANWIVFRALGWIDEGGIVNFFMFMTFENISFFQLNKPINQGTVSN